MLLRLTLYAVSYVDGLCMSDVFLFQAEDGIRDLVRSRGLGDVYKRQPRCIRRFSYEVTSPSNPAIACLVPSLSINPAPSACLLYTSDAADERSSVDLGGRRIIKKKNITIEHADHRSARH